MAAIGIRTGPDELIEELAAHATVPVINMLTPRHHPCQALADLLTLRETFGHLDGLTARVCRRRQQRRAFAGALGPAAGVRSGSPSPTVFQLESGRGRVLTDDPREAVAGADAIYTDVWVSMSDDPDSAAERRRALAPYQLDRRAARPRRPEAIALHCLPAHPGEEITAQVLYGARERIWDQAENRRHAQKALLELLVAPAVRNTPDAASATLGT